MSVPRLEIASGYSISRLIKGGWHLAGGHGEVDRHRAIEDMAAFVEAGITTFDCADIYTGVEALIGEFRQAYPTLAERVQVHTKFVPDFDRLGSVDGKYVESIIDRSRARLGVDVLDLVQFHWWDLGVPRYVQTALELLRLRDVGKIRHVALTNFSTDCVREMVEAGVPITSIQVQYSLLDGRPARKLIEYCQRHGIALLCYGSLAGGFLSGRWLGQPEPFEAFENRSLTKYKLIIDDAGGWAWFQRLLEALQQVAERHTASLSQVVVRWLLEQPGVSAAIIGATSQLHLPENLHVFDLHLSSDDFAVIDNVLAQRAELEGDVYDLERDKTGRHGRIMKYNLNEDRT